MATQRVWDATRRLRRRYNRLWFRDHAVRTVTRKDNAATARRLDLYERLVAETVALGGQRQPIDVLENPDPADFHRRYFDADIPVVLKGVGKNWPAASWTPQVLGERYRDTTVRLLRVAPNEAKGKPGEGRDASYAEIAQSMAEGGDLYARFSGIFHQHPELVDDLDVEWFRTMRNAGKRFENWGFFMGGAKTATGLHSSIAPNLFYQITGEKRWFIYPAKAAPFFAPAVKCSPYFYSEVDVSDPETWPIAEAAPGWVADLEPGDVLFVPSFAWHQVHNFSPTMAVGYRWISIAQGWRNSPIQTFLAATCSNPPVWKAKGHKDLPTLLDAIDY